MTARSKLGIVSQIKAISDSYSRHGEPVVLQPQFAEHQVLLARGSRPMYLKLRMVGVLLDRAIFFFVTEFKHRTHSGCCSGLELGSQNLAGATEAGCQICWPGIPGEFTVLTLPSRQ